MEDKLTSVDDGGAGLEPIAELRRLTELRARLSRDQGIQVRRARNKGYSWQAIADALGVSRQAAHRKFRRD